MPDQQMTFDDLAAIAADIRPYSPGRADAIEHADPTWWDQAEAAVRALAATGQRFTTYDLTRKPYCVPEPDDHHRWGAFMAAMARKGLIEKAGFTTSRRPDTAGSAVREWRAPRQEAA